MKSVILGHFHVKAGHPLGSSLPHQDVIVEHLGRIAPLFDAKASTRRIFLIICGTAHNFGGKPKLTASNEHRHVLLALEGTS